jgi:hypothetical protein
MNSRHSIFSHCITPPARSGFLILAVVLGGCSSLGPGDVNLSSVDVENCEVTNVTDPESAAKKGVLVCIVFNDDDCPTETVYGGVDNGTALLNQNNNDREKLIWQAVKRDENDPDQYHAFEFPGKYEVVFDPFKGYTISSKRNQGWAKSKPIDCTGTGSSRCRPPGIEYKYTVWVPAADPAVCAPLDPMFRVNN